MGDISLTISLKPRRPQSVGLKANRIQKLRKQFPNPVSGHGLSVLESQELNLLDRDRFVRSFLA
jgi:hypothetical protein